MKKIIIILLLAVTTTAVYGQSFSIMPSSKQTSISGMDWRLFSSSASVAERQVIDLGKFLKWYEKSGALRGGIDTYIVPKTGIASLSYGIDVEASGDASYAFGVGVHSFNYSGFACGMFNSHETNSSTQDHPLNRLFAVGYGVSESNTRDAFIVKRNGNIGIGTESVGSRLDICGRNDDGYAAFRRAQVAIQSGEATTYFNDFERSGASFINGHNFNSAVVLSEASISKVGVGIYPDPNGAKLQVNGDIDALDIYGDNIIANQYWLYTSSPITKTFLASYPQLEVHIDLKGKKYIDFMQVVQLQMEEAAALKAEIKVLKENK